MLDIEYNKVLNFIHVFKKNTPLVDKNQAPKISKKLFLKPIEMRLYSYSSSKKAKNSQAYNSAFSSAEPQGASRCITRDGERAKSNFRY